MIETLEVKSVVPAPPKEKAAPEIPPALKEAFHQSPMGSGKMQAEIALPEGTDPAVGQQIGKALVKGLKAHASKNKEDAWGAGFELVEGIIRLWWSRRRARRQRRNAEETSVRAAKPDLKNMLGDPISARDVAILGGDPSL